MNQELNLMLNVLRDSGEQKLLAKFEKLNFAEKDDFATVFNKVKKLLSPELKKKILAERFGKERNYEELLSSFL